MEPANYNQSAITSANNLQSSSSTKYWLLAQFVFVLALVLTSSHIAAQNVSLDNTGTACSYSVKVYYATGFCDSNCACWRCTGAQSNTTYSIAGNASHSYILPAHTNVCKYEIYDASNNLVTTCDCSAASGGSCTFGPYTDCHGDKIYIDMNSGCTIGTDNGSGGVRWHM